MVDFQAGVDIIRGARLQKFGTTFEDDAGACGNSDQRRVTPRHSNLIPIPKAEEAVSLKLTSRANKLMAILVCIEGEYEYLTVPGFLR